MYTPNNVLLTGVAGFICSNVAVHLVKKYPNINFVGIDKMSYCSNVNSIKEIINDDNFKFVKADITKLDDMSDIFSKYNIDTVMHFAAYTHVDHSFGNSIIFTQNNVVGTHILLEVSKNKNIKRFIHVSTDEVYGCQNTMSHEYSMLDPTNPYAATKAAAEHIVRSYYHSFKLPVIITRGNNVYGPKQYPEKVIPKFCLRLLSDQNCQIQGSGQQMRSFLYVLDVAKAFDLILFKGEIGETYNIGSIEEHTILEVAERLIKLITNTNPNNSSTSLIEHIQDREFNDQRYYISSEKIMALGWKPEISFEDGLELTVDWYKNNPDFWDSLPLKSL